MYIATCACDLCYFFIFRPELRSSLLEVVNQKHQDDSDEDDEEDDITDEQDIVYAHYLGTALVSTVKWWKQPVLAQFQGVQHTPEKLCESACIVLSEPIVNKKQVLGQPAAVLISKEQIQVELFCSSCQA